MVGFGRAVGETMIVLMATGNTPVMEWSIFNGIRTLSANIAVEIPEAPHGGTLYRTLFLAAALLFVMTFVVNTIAEIIRQRLRERYKADLMATARTDCTAATPAIWLAGSGLGICLLMIGGMIALILTNGLGFFWPGRLDAAHADTTARCCSAKSTAAKRIPQPGTPEHLEALPRPAEARQPRPDRRRFPLDRRRRDRDARTPGDVALRRAPRVRPVHRPRVAIVKDGDRPGRDRHRAGARRRCRRSSTRPTADRDAIRAHRARRARRRELPDRAGAPGAARGSSSRRGETPALTRARETAAIDAASRGAASRSTPRLETAARRDRRGGIAARASRCRPPTAPRRNCRRSTSTASTPANQLSTWRARRRLREPAVGVPRAAIRANRTPRGASSRRSSAP